MTKESEHKFSRTAAIITVSDRGSRGEREDLSGDWLHELLSEKGYQIVFRSIVADEVSEIQALLRSCCDDQIVALVITTGGTGVSPRDVTPDATRQILDREVSGMAEAMRAASLAKTPHAMLSRALAGIRGQSLIVNLPGSPKGAVENLQAILPALDHALDKIQGDPTDCAQ